jgi:hypothetical protein
MQRSDIPVKFAVVWGEDAAGGTIRTVPVNPTGQAGAASVSGGFGSLNFVQVAAGGVPPFGQDINGVLQVIYEWSQWAQAGGAQPFDGTFAGEIGGYPKSSLLPAASQAGIWYNLADNNAENPDTGGANWILIGPGMTIGALGGDISGTIADAVINDAAVTGAKIAPDTVVNSNLLEVTGPVVKGRLSGTGPVQDLEIVPSSPGSYLLIPLADGRTYIRAWGTNAPVVDGSVTPVDFPIDIGTPEGVNLTTANNSGSGNNAQAQLIDGSLSSSGFDVKMQNFAGSAGPNQAFSWEAFGYV